MAAGVRLLAAVGACMLSEPGGYAEALPANPAAKWSQAAVDAFVILKVGQLAEALATCGALDDGKHREGVTDILDRQIIDQCYL